MIELLCCAALGGVSFDPTLLRGAKDFVMTMYGGPSDAADLQAVVTFNHDNGLCEGFDPISATMPPDAFDVLLHGNLSIVNFYGGPDFEVPDGDAPGNIINATGVKERLLTLNKTMYVSIGFGEYGYFFHCLQPENSINWWHSIYPNQSDFDRHKHCITPYGLDGYRSFPKSHKEGYEAVTAYVMERRADYQGFMQAMLTGYMHYTEMYGARWGATAISMEVGEGIKNTQSKYAFARGSARRYGLPWSAQVSPWHANSFTTSGPVREINGTWWGEDSGHSTSFYQRMFLHCWFAGAAFLTPENSYSYFFTTPPAAGTQGVLSAKGEMAKSARKLMRTHDRGTPYVPVVVVIDVYAGYTQSPCNTAASAWGIFTENSQAAETAHLTQDEVPIQILSDLFEQQIWPSQGRGDDVQTVEQVQLRPTPYGELVDVSLSDAPAEYLTGYRALLIAGGDVNFTGLGDVLCTVLTGPDPPMLYLQDYHVSALQQLGLWSKLNQTGKVGVLQKWKNPVTGRNTAVPNDKLAQLSTELMPLSVTGNLTVQWGVNRSPTSWVVEVLNNDGVYKEINAAATYDYTKTAGVIITTKFAFASAVAWGPDSDEKLHGQGAEGTTIDIVLPPGGIQMIEFKL